MPEEMPVFAWITGQDFNIGDSLLRRPYVAILEDVGEVDILVRGASDEFVTGLGVKNAVVTSSTRRWYARLIASAFRRPTLLALNAGQIHVSPGRSIFLLALCIAGVLARLRGGSVVWIGGTVRQEGTSLQRIPYYLAARQSALLRWRAEPKLPRLGGRVVGDWAFATGTSVSEWPPSRERRQACFVMRGDGPPLSERWLQWALSTLRETGLAPVFVVQVKSDRTLAFQLADLLGGRVLDWPTGLTHAEQEARVRQEYRSARIVVGNRLHGLIIGASEGAVPIGWTEWSRGKIAHHFDAVGMNYVGRHEDAAFIDAAPVTDEELRTYEAELGSDIDRVRRVLQDCEEELRALVLGR